jgi:hypothetical protein
MEEKIRVGHQFESGIQLVKQFFRLGWNDGKTATWALK